MLYSIVIPCYNSGATIGEVVDLLIGEMEKLGKTPFEIILVNDCSPDGGRTFQAIETLCSKYPFIKGIDLAINAGQHNAIMAGLNYCSGDVLIGMDDDLQTHPSQLYKLFAKLDEGYDVVYAKYPQSKQSFVRVLMSRLNNWSVRILIGKPKDLATSSFWVAKKYIIDSIIDYTNPYAHIQGLFLRTTKNIGNADVEHFRRTNGKSNYTLKKLMRLWSSFTNYSIVPLRFAMLSGVLFSFAGFVASIVVVIQKLLNPETPAGWPSLMCLLLIVGGLILLFLGIIGEYIGRIFISLNNSPQYVIRKKLNIEQSCVDPKK